MFFGVIKGFKAWNFLTMDSSGITFNQLLDKVFTKNKIKGVNETWQFRAIKIQLQKNVYNKILKSNYLCKLLKKVYGGEVLALCWRYYSKKI